MPASRITAAVQDFLLNLPSITTQQQSLRPQQAAALLGVSIATFWRWLALRADMPRPRRLSARCTVFDRDELLAWRDAHIARRT